MTASHKRFFCDTAICTVATQIKIGNSTENGKEKKTSVNKQMSAQSSGLISMETKKRSGEEPEWAEMQRASSN